MISSARSILLLVAAFAGAGLLVFLHSWGIEETWIKPSMVPREEGAAGRAQWGGMIPEFRNPPRIFLDNDPYYWIRYAQRVARGEVLRVRETDLDNVPYGREVHWNSGFVWLLVASGLVASLFTGQPLVQAIETGSLYANPVFFLIVLGGTGWWIARRWGVSYAAALVFTLSALPAVMWDFGFARPDHHGMHNAAALVLLLGLMVAGGGWVAGSRRHNASPAALGAAQRAMTLSALGAATGLWVGATQQIFILAGAGAGLTAAIFWPTRKNETAESLAPELFRRWGRVGAVSSLALYVVEFFPDHLGMRLEVNHPLYAFALWGAGEILGAAAEWKTSGRPPRGGDLWKLIAAAVLVALPALALLAGPADWHVWHNPVMKRQHSFIDEFEPFTNALRASGWTTMLARFGLLPLAIPLGAMLVFSRRIVPSLRAGLLVGLGASVVTGAMLFVQVRWAGLLSISLACLFLAALRAGSLWLGESRIASWRKTIFGAGYTAAVLPLIFFFAMGFRDGLARREAKVMDPVLAWTIANRDLAFNLKRLEQLGPVRVMSGPGQTPALHFFGGIRGTASLYWDNEKGVADAAFFFADQGDAEARRIARERGITHVVLQADTTLAESSVRIALDSDDPELIKQSLAYRLANPAGEVPKWLEPVPYYGSPMAANFQMRVFRVRTDKL